VIGPSTDGLAEEGHMLRFLISFTVCTIATAFAGWALVTLYPVAAAESGLALGLLAGGIGALVFWLTFGILLAFDLD